MMKLHISRMVESKKQFYGNFQSQIQFCQRQSKLYKNLDELFIIDAVIIV